MIERVARLAAITCVVAPASSSCAKIEADRDPGPKATRFEDFILNADGTTDVTVAVKVRFPRGPVERAYAPGCPCAEARAAHPRCPPLFELP